MLLPLKPLTRQATGVTQGDQKSPEVRYQYPSTTVMSGQQYH